jgi:hypothetical protein
MTSNYAYLKDTILIHVHMRITLCEYGHVVQSSVNDLPFVEGGRSVLLLALVSRYAWLGNVPNADGNYSVRAALCITLAIKRGAFKIRFIVPRCWAK